MSFIRPEHLAEPIKRSAAVLLRSFLDLAYPPICVACPAAIDRSDGLCAECWTRISFIEQPYCAKLGLPFPHDLGDGALSPAADVDPPVYGRARAVARYEDGPARKLVHALKYGDRLELARPMGRWMTRAGADLLKDADLLIPMPLHRMRLFRRTFNQASELTRHISKESGLPWDSEALSRLEATRPQVGLSKAQRAINVRGAFQTSSGAEMRIGGKRLLLIDDVLTSGATMNAAARALFHGGAACVDALVFARVVNGQ